MSELLEHYYLLKNPRRISAYRKALRAAVRPGDVVLDAGCGTGILGFLALQAGAGHVVGIDRHPVVFLARELAKQNGLADRTTFVHGALPEGPLPRKFDLLISDLIGHGGVDPKVLKLLGETERRWGNPGCRVLPHAAHFFLTPARCPRLYRRVTEWDRGFCGLNLEAVRGFMVHRGFHLYDPTTAAGPRVPLGTLALGRFDRRRLPLEWEATLPIRRSGTVHGVKWDYGLEIGPGILIGSVLPMGRPPLFFPIHPAPSMRSGDRLTVTFIVGEDRNWSWSAEGRRGGRRLFRRHFAGALANLMELGQYELSPEWKPLAPKKIQEAADLLGRMDGRRTLGLLAREWARRTGKPVDEAMEEAQDLCLEFKVGGSR